MSKGVTKKKGGGDSTRCQPSVSLMFFPQFDLSCDLFLSNCSNVKITCESSTINSTYHVNYTDNYLSQETEIYFCINNNHDNFRLAFSPYSEICFPSKSFKRRVHHFG